MGGVEGRAAAVLPRREREFRSLSLSSLHLSHHVGRPPQLFQVGRRGRGPGWHAKGQAGHLVRGPVWEREKGESIERSVFRPAAATSAPPRPCGAPGAATRASAGRVSGWHSPGVNPPRHARAHQAARSSPPSKPCIASESQARTSSLSSLSQLSGTLAAARVAPPCPRLRGLDWARGEPTGGRGAAGVAAEGAGVCVGPRAPPSRAQQAGRPREKKSVRVRRRVARPPHPSTLEFSPALPVPSHTISQPTHLNSHSTMRAAATVTRPGAALAPGLGEFVCGWLPRPPPSTSRPSNDRAYNRLLTRAPLPLPPTYTARRPTSARRAAALVVRAEDVKVRERREERGEAGRGPVGEEGSRISAPASGGSAPAPPLCFARAPAPAPGSGPRTTRTRAADASPASAWCGCRPSDPPVRPRKGARTRRGEHTAPPRLSLASAALWV